MGREEKRKFGCGVFRRKKKKWGFGGEKAKVLVGLCLDFRWVKESKELRSFR